MSSSISTSFVEQYKSNVLHLAQQKGSRLRGSVLTETVTGKSHYFERLASTAAVEKVSRHADTPLVSQTHSRRKVSLRDFEWADLIDDMDKVKQLIDTQSAYTTNASNAMGRKLDDLIIAAATGNAYSGVSGGTSVALPSGSKVVHASGGLTIAKLVSAKKILDENEVDPSQPRFIAVSAEQIEDLLNNTTVTSADYNTVRALVSGNIDTFMGFKFIRSERLGTDATPSRQVIAWAKNAIGLAIGKDVTASIDKRADKSMAMQVYFCFSAEATRIEDEAVVEIACNE